MTPKNVLISSLRASSWLLTGSLLLGASFAISSGCSADADPGTGDAFEDVDVAGLTFEEFKARAYKEPFEGGVWIVNGDEPVATEGELEEFYLRLIGETVVESGSLIVHQVSGADAKWSDAQKTNISYCVSTTFGTNYNAVVAAMNSATQAWESATVGSSGSCINFVHNSGQDSNCTASNANVVFDVRPVSGQGYLARAFFPNQSRSTRNVLIDSSSFGNISPYTLTGILRHELGHTLGYRHEHTRPEAGTCFEDNSWRALTTYDSSSVMHYPQCNGSQTGDLVITAKDTEGSKSLYCGGSQPPPPPPPTCHDVCVTGAALASSCGTVASTVCAADSYCCTTGWDSICVGEVESVAKSLVCQQGSCAHSPCTTGGALVKTCDADVTAICNADAYCCTTSWDSICVGEVSSVAGKNCNK